MKSAGVKYLTIVPRESGKEETFRSVGACAVPASCDKPEFWIRTAADPLIGFGHLRRSVTLARLLNDTFHPVFLCDVADKWTQEEARGHSWSVELLASSGIWTDRRVPAGLLIDSRQEAGLRDLIIEARSRSIPVLSIHDLGLNPLPSDAVIDGSIFPVTEGFPRRETAFYTGTAYLVLGPVFGLLHQQRKRIKDRVQSITVILGGGDSRRYFEKTLTGLRAWGKDIEVTGFAGFTEWGQEEVAARDWGPLRFRWAGRTEPVERSLIQSDIAITAGGLTAFEALCVGTPLLALSHDGYQHFTVSMLAKADACIDLGEGELLKPESLPAILTELDESRARRERMSFNGRQIVDGRGAERVSALIRKIVNEAVLIPRPVGI